MPVASCVWPLPSTTTRTSISVSAVRRATCALRTGDSIGAFMTVYPSVSLEHTDERIVFGGRTDGNSQAVREQWMRAVQILDQDLRVAKRCKPGVGVRHARKHEVGLRREYPYARQSRKGQRETRPFRADRCRLSREQVAVREQDRQRRLREAAHVVRRAQLVELRDPVRMAD